MIILLWLCLEFLLEWYANFTRMLPGCFADIWLMLVILYVTVISHERHGVANHRQLDCFLTVCLVWHQRTHKNLSYWACMREIRHWAVLQHRKCFHAMTSSRGMCEPIAGHDKLRAVYIIPEMSSIPNVMGTYKSDNGIGGSHPTNHSRSNSICWQTIRMSCWNNSLLEQCSNYIWPVDLMQRRLVIWRKYKALRKSSLHRIYSWYQCLASVVPCVVQLIALQKVNNSEFNARWPHLPGLFHHHQYTHAISSAYELVLKDIGGIERNQHNKARWKITIPRHVMYYFSFSLKFTENFHVNFPGFTPQLILWWWFLSRKMWLM